MKIKTSELTGAALDWAVCKAGGGAKNIRTWVSGYYDYNMYQYSTDWSQGGPIIERIKGIQLKAWLESKPESCCEAHIHNYDGNWIQFGPTLLIAAMRCYVASNLGDEVDIPEGLI